MVKFMVAGETTGQVSSSKVYDRFASTCNEPLFREGNAAEAELSTLGMADGSVTLGQLAPDALAKIGLDHNPATAEVACSPSRWGLSTSGYSLHKRFDVLAI